MTKPTHSFAALLTRWQRSHGRHDLPWQQRDAYRVWLSEIMLQQTQVATVIPYYQRFLACFPDIASLAAAPADEVMGLWSGLGYYARARNLQSAAQRVVAQHGGEFPRDLAAIAALPGIGRSTAAAIAVFAFDARAAILDGNVKRVLSRCFGIEGWYGEKAVEQRLWALAESLLPSQDVGAYTQGLMDLGATVCTRGKPACAACPLATLCVAHREDRVASLPTPRPKRVQPQRAVTLLVLRHEQRVLLEKRPPSGIWGGLYSLPELPAHSDAATFVSHSLGCELRPAGKSKTPALQALPTVDHAFTHFRLAIKPLLGEVAKLHPAAHETGYLWVDLQQPQQLDGAPLPAPIRKILAAIR